MNFLHIGIGMPGIPELIIILLIILVIFGAGRVKKIMGEFGSGISEFKKGLKDGEEKKDDKPTKKNPPDPNSN